MPPRARTKTPHQQTPWASGRRRTPRRKQPWAKRVQQGFRKQLRKRPVLGLILQIAFAVLAVVLLVTGLLLENVLFYLATTLAGLGGVATRRAVFLEQERQRKNGGPKVTMPPPSSRSSKPKPDGSAPRTASGGVVKCTDTGKPISECGCASRHVATEDGSDRYGKPVGSPIGRKAKQRSTGGTIKTGG